MGRLSEYYDDPLEFRPERWLDADGNELAVKPKAFAPFHAGPRTCLGKDMVGERYPIPIFLFLFLFLFYPILFANQSYSFYSSSSPSF